MYSFTITNNKESISVSVRPKRSKYELTVSLSGDPYTRFLINDPVIAHYSRDGDLKVTLDRPKVVLYWGILDYVYDDRRITLDLAEGKFTVETHDMTGPHKAWAMPINHDFTSNPAPSYKLYKYKGEMKAKLL